MLEKFGILCANLFCLFVFCLNVHAIPGDLDTTFDGDGKTSTSLGVYDFAWAVAIQPDGKIVAAGHTDTVNPPTNADISLVRYNADGSLDTSFGTGGKVLLTESGVQRANSVIILPDGKILAVGIYLGHVGVFRFNANGSLDTTFDTDGKVNHVIGAQSAGNDAVLQPDGKIVIVGFVQPMNDSQKFTVFRLNPDGSLDTSFNSTGYTIVPHGGSYATTVALESDGGIVAGGKDQGGDLTGYLGHFSTDGFLESPDLAQCNVQIEDVAVQPDGKVVFAGYIRYSGTGTVTAVIRFNTDNTPDMRFGNNGIIILDWGEGGFLSRGTSLFLEPDGRIVLGGHARIQNAFHLGIARFNAHGFPDIGFGNGGKVTTPFGQVSKLARQSDGKIVAVGYNEFGGGADYVAARYNTGASNTLPNRAQYDWDGDGRADIAVFRPSTATWYVLNSFNSSVSIRVFGIPGDVPTPADYDGDAKTDHSIYRNGVWWRLESSGNGTPLEYPFTITGFPRPGDFNGDQRADIITYSFGFWRRRNPIGIDNADVAFGTTGDKPLLGDFDGDAKTDPAIYRPATGEWWYAASSAGGQHRAARWGIAEDIPVPGDYDGDFITDFAVYRASEGIWYIYNSSDGSVFIMRFGLAEDKPVAADYDGDGKADIAVFRPSTGIWYLLRSTAGFTALQFGISTDIPPPNAFVP